MIFGEEQAIADHGRLKSAVKIKAYALILAKANAFAVCNRSLSVYGGLVRIYFDRTAEGKVFFKDLALRCPVPHFLINVKLS